MKIENHWLNQSTKIVSPNYDERPVEDEIYLIVIHCISLPPDQFGGGFIDQLFCNQLNPEEHCYFEEVYQLKVSAHLLITREGRVIQYVPFNKRAWHAGVSEYKGRQQCNDYSIGIELEGSENIEYTNAQYKQLSFVIRCLVSHYSGLSTQKLVGHSDIAPGRKTDPGGSFLWEKLYTNLRN